jgi:unsaturated rhamnogalacturonyl hydrolase
MTTLPRFSAALLLVLAAVAPASADGPFRNRDNPNPADREDGAYAVPYQKPTVEEIAAVLGRVRAYLDQAAVPEVISRDTGAVITDFSAVRADAIPSRGEAGAFGHLDYTMGVVHSGMLLAAEATGDRRFAEFTERRLRFLADRLPYFSAQAEKFGTPANGFRAALEPRALDDSGSMCAALIKARLAGVGPDLRPLIDRWGEYVRRGQFRIDDGTLARQRPQARSLWADDTYMSIPALAQMGRLTGDRAWLDEAAQQVLGFARHLFNRQTGLYMHGRNLDQPYNPEFYWGRANGWAAMATVELLDVLPADHPARAQIIELLGAHLRALAPLQSDQGLWHQMLDKPDSYLETSASAAFVYAIARAINRGWISPIGLGSVAQAGWIGVATRVNDRGQVEGSCVGTTFANDNIYYYHRPASPYATHGYGPVLLAGAEMIRLLQNPDLTIQLRLRTYHYVPKAGAQPVYR